MTDILSLISSLLRRVKELEERVSRSDKHVWATVENINPLRVVVDGSSRPISGVGASLVGPLTAGQRVEVRVSGTQLTVTGARPISPPGANTIRIDGRDYLASGSVAVQLGSWAYTKAEGNGTTLQIPFPTDLPPGWTFETFTLTTYGFTFVQTGSIDRAARRIHARVYQYLSRDLNALSRIGWRLVKETH